MNTLYTFGCSFTEDYNDLPLWRNSEQTLKQVRRGYVHDFLGLEKFPNWTSQLADRLGYEDKNCAAVSGYKTPDLKYITGNCNTSIRNSISHFSDQYKEGDILVIEWTFMTRFRLYDEQGGIMRSYVTNTEAPVGLESVFDTIVINRSHPFWIDELFMNMKIINELAKAKKFHVFYWTIDNSILRHKLDEIKHDKRWLLNDMVEHDRTYHDLIKQHYGGKTIEEETNGLIGDHHLGITAHNIMGKIFYDYIIQNLTL